MPLQTLPIVPLCIIPVLAGKRVACSLVSGKSHPLLAPRKREAEDNCCLSTTAVNIASAITNDLKIQVWTCINCKNGNVTSGSCTKCGLDYKACILSISKVWVHTLSKAPGQKTTSSKSSKPITHLEVATILMSPHGVENTGLQNPSWVTHNAMRCDECTYVEPEPTDTANNDASADMRVAEPNTGEGVGTGELVTTPPANAPVTLYPGKYPKESNFVNLLQVAGDAYPAKMLSRRLSIRQVREGICCTTAIYEHDNPVDPLVPAQGVPQVFYKFTRESLFARLQFLENRADKPTKKDGPEGEPLPHPVIRAIRDGTYDASDLPGNRKRSLDSANDGQPPAKRSRKFSLTAGEWRDILPACIQVLASQGSDTQIAGLTRLLVKKSKKVKVPVIPQPISTATAPAEAVVAAVALAPVVAAVVDAQATQSDVGGGGIVNDNVAPEDQSRGGARGGRGRAARPRGRGRGAGSTANVNQGSSNGPTKGGNRDYNANDNRNSYQREYTGHVCKRWNHARSQECTYFVSIRLGFCAACGAPAAHPYNSRPRGGRGGFGRGGRGGYGNRY